MVLAQCIEVLRQGRAWIRNAEGLHEISLEEYKQHNRTVRGRIYPFIIMEFHIQRDRKRVVLGDRQASMAGWGGRDLVEGEVTRPS